MSVEKNLKAARACPKAVPIIDKVITPELSVYQFHVVDQQKMYREVLTPVEWQRFKELNGMAGRIVTVTLNMTTREADVREHASKATRIGHCPFPAGTYGRDVWIRHWYSTHGQAVIGVGLDESLAIWKVIGFLKLKPSQRLVIRELLAYHWKADYTTVEQRMDHLLEKIGDM